MAVAGVRTHAIEDHRPSSPLGLNLNEYFVNQLNPKCEMPIPNPFFFFWVVRAFVANKIFLSPTSTWHKGRQKSHGADIFENFLYSEKV